MRAARHAGPHGTVTVTACQVRCPAGDAAVGPIATVGFVHGLGGGHAIWAQLVEALPDDVAIWAFGLPWDAGQGYGWAVGSEPRVWLRRALELMPVQPDVLVAHSFGANVLLDHVATHGTGALTGLVLLSPFYRPSPDAFTWPVISHYLNDFTDLLAAGISARGAPPADLLAAMAEKVRDRISPYGWMRFFELFTATPMLDLAAITVPCLVVGGGRDTASYPDDNRSLARRLTRGTVEILAQSGHFAMIDDPRRVAALVDEFLRSRRHG